MYKDIKWANDNYIEDLLATCASSLGIIKFEQLVIY